MILAIAIILFAAAFGLVKLAWKKKAEKPNAPTWFQLQMAGSGIGLVSFFLFWKLVA